jgi:hypothetical protein
MSKGNHSWMSSGSYLVRWSALLLVVLTSLVLGVAVFARTAGTGTVALQPLDTWSRVALEGRAVRGIEPMGASIRARTAAAPGRGYPRLD